MGLRANTKAKIVQLWHGTPIKRVGNLNNSRPWYKYDDAYSLVLATSNYAWQIMKACFDYNNSKRIICPYPRCDAIDRGLTEEQKWYLQDLLRLELYFGYPHLEPRIMKSTHVAAKIFQYSAKAMLRF